MIKKWGIVLTAVSILLSYGTANASLTVIGNANYLGTDYKLIYEDNSIYGGLVWLDYTHYWYNTWQEHMNWASGLGANLEVTLNPGYTTNINWRTGWRLPTVASSSIVDPWGGGTTAEMDHLYYISLGKPAYHGRPGEPRPELTPDYYSPFEHLMGFSLSDPTGFNPAFFSDTPYGPWKIWFDFYFGYQGAGWGTGSSAALAVHPGEVYFNPVPIPGAVWLFGSGLIGLLGFRRKFMKG